MVKGLCDGSCGLVGPALLAFAGAQAETWFVLVVALVSLDDTIVVLRRGGTKAVAFGIDFTTAVVPISTAPLCAL